MKTRTKKSYRITVTEVLARNDEPTAERTIYEATTPVRPSLIALAELVEGAGHGA